MCEALFGNSKNGSTYSKQDNSGEVRAAGPFDGWIQNLGSQVANASQNAPPTVQFAQNEQADPSLAAVQKNTGVYQPYINQASAYTNASAAPITEADINKTLNSSGLANQIKATQAQFDTHNAQEQQKVAGNATLAGAFGGNRGAVAQALTTQAQQEAQAPVIANLNNQAYGQASQLAQANRAAQGQAGFATASLANQAQSAGLVDANALLNAGSAVQANQQGVYNAPIQNYQLAQAQLGTDASILSGLSGSYGSNTQNSGQGEQTKYNYINPTLGWAKVGLGAIGAAKDGGSINVPQHRDMGGSMGSIPGITAYQPPQYQFTPIHPAQMPTISFGNDNSPNNNSGNKSGSQSDGLGTAANIGSLFGKGIQAIGTAMGGGAPAYVDPLFQGMGLTANQVDGWGFPVGLGDSGAAAGGAAADAGATVRGFGKGGIADADPGLNAGYDNPYYDYSDADLKAGLGAAANGQSDSLTPLGVVSPREASGFGQAYAAPSAPYDYGAAVRKFEGFSPSANWDFKQYTNGYGTKARSPNETIDQTEARSRFDNEYGTALSAVDAFQPELPEGTRQALASLTFNAGNKWMNSGLGEAIKSGDMDRARASFLQYANAGGEFRPGLRDRRAQEAAWLGGEAPSSPADGNQGNYDGRMALGGPQQTRQPPLSIGLTPQDIARVPDLSDVKQPLPIKGILHKLFGIENPLVSNEDRPALLAMAGAPAGKNNIDTIANMFGAAYNARNDDIANRTRVAKLQHDAQVAAATLQRTDPVWELPRAVEARKAVADQIGLEKGSRSYTNFLATGQVPELSKKAFEHVTRTNPNTGEQQIGSFNPMTGEVHWPNESTNIPITDGLHGKDLLDALPPQVAGEVKAMAEGREQWPTQAALRNPLVLRKLQLVQQYDPTASADRYNLHKKFFVDGQAENTRALNTALGHMGHLAEAIPGVNNTDWLPGVVNPVANKIMDVSSGNFQAREKRFTTDRDAVASELMKVFRGGGGASEREIEEWRKNLNLNDARSAQLAGLTEASKLLESRLQAAERSYNEGMGPLAPKLNLLSPEAKEALEALKSGKFGKKDIEVLKKHGQLADSVLNKSQSGATVGSHQKDGETAASSESLSQETMSNLKALWNANKSTTQARRRQAIREMHKAGLTEKQVEDIVMNR